VRENKSSENEKDLLDFWYLEEVLSLKCTRLAKEENLLSVAAVGIYYRSNCKTGSFVSL
jgi:hypothetical protein